MRVLEFMGLINSKTPTQLWRDYRSSPDHKATLGQAIRSAYADLFHTFPNAHELDGEQLKSYFRAHSDGGDKVIANTLSTFTSLRGAATFDAVAAATTSAKKPGAVPAQERATNHTREQQRVPRHAPTGPEVHIDIQVHISADMSPEQIDTIFSSMAKHLYGQD